MGNKFPIIKPIILNPITKPNKSKNKFFWLKKNRISNYLSTLLQEAIKRNPGSLSHN